MNVLVRLSRPWFAALAFAFAAVAAVAAPNFPALTGRVVDQAGVLSSGVQASLTARLADLEQKSSIQLVVATVSSLEGVEVEPYANDLFRAWKLGEAQKNNGVLLLVAPHEHKVRIEVGYGLEGTLTDAVSKIIIVNAITPRFKANDFDGGVTRGVDDIITTLTTDASEWQSKPDFRSQHAAQNNNSALPLVFFFAIILLIIVSNARRGGGYRSSSVVPWVVGSSAWRGSDSSGGGGSGGDSFSGGGGSSGGGGASGGW